MGNELTYDFGMPVTLHYTIANIAGTATTALKFANGGLGLKVPTGYSFHPLLISAESNAAVQGGTATFKATANTTVSINGPSAALTTAAQVAVGAQRVGAEPIGAGKIVGVSVVTAGFTPTTADVDAILTGVLLPA